MLSFKEWYRIYIKRGSFEHVVHQIENVPLRGDDKILAKAEKYRMQLELCNYFNQQLECLSRKVLITNPILSAEYKKESCFVIEKLKKPITEYLLFVQAQNPYNLIIQSCVERNVMLTDMKDLTKQYEGCPNIDDFTHVVALIDTYISRCKNKNKK